MTRLLPLHLLLDTSDKKVMATLKCTAVEWAARSGLGADKCGLLSRLRSAISLGDNLCSGEVVVEPVKAFGYVAPDIRKGAFLPDEGKIVSATGKVTHISTATTSHIPYMRLMKKEIKLPSRCSTILHLRPHQQQGPKVFSVMSSLSMRLIGKERQLQ